jgi:hypothetical protein
MKIVQVDLENIDGPERLTTWVDALPGLKTGSVITLKDFKETIKWRIKKIYTAVYKESTDFDFHRTWDNNNYDKHKGLGV